MLASCREALWGRLLEECASCGDGDGGGESGLGASGAGGVCGVTVTVIVVRDVHRGGVSVCDLPSCLSRSW